MMLAVEPVSTGFLIFQLIVTAIAIGASYLASRSKGKDGRTDADAFASGDNPSDPRQPIPMVYGRPIHLYPVLTDYALPTAVNSWSPDSTPGRVTVLSLGGGPVDGGDAQLWIDDVPSSVQIDDTDPTSDQTLTRESGTLRYSFGHGNVVDDSVSIYVDGVFYGSYSEEAGRVSVVIEQTSSLVASARHFTKNTDGTFTPTGSLVATYLGCLLGTDGAVKAGSVQATLLQTQPTVFVRFRSGTSDSSAYSIPVPDADIHIAKTKDGEPMAWFDVTGGTAGKERSAKFKFDLTYQYTPFIDIETDESGTSFAVFREDPGSSAVVTAHYKAGKLAEHTETFFRPGTPDQDELPIDDGVRSTVNVGGALTQGTKRSYSTINDVDELEIGIQSGPAGMYEIRVETGAFRAATRELEIQIKASTAPDTRSNGNSDINAGWVRLVSKDGDELQNIGGQTRGTATWTFSIAQAWSDTLRHTPRRTNLPFGKYDVEVVALDTAGGDNVENDLVFAYATEIQRNKLALPHHATYTVKVTDPDVVGSAPTYALGIMGRRVWVPSATAVYSATTGRPEPGTHKWTRNPIWCACDLIVDPILGGGQFYKWSNIDVAEALVAAAFCDATVTNADGTTEVRSEVDIVLDTRDALSKQVARMLVGQQVIGALAGGTWRFLPDVDAAAVMALTSDDYQRDEITMSYGSIENAPNEILYSFPNELMDFEPDSDTVRVSGAEPAQRVTTEVTFDGVRRRSQAVRAASLLLRQLQLQRRTVEIICSGWRALLLEAGDIVTLTAPELKLTTWKCRVQSVEFGSTLTTRLRLGEHDPTAYDDAWLGPIGAVEPGNRPLPADASVGTTTTKVLAGSSNIPLTKVWANTRGLQKFSVSRVSGRSDG